MKTNKTFSLLMVGVALLLLVPVAMAEEVYVYGVEGPQDPLGIYDDIWADEVGWNPPFPMEESIISGLNQMTDYSPCPESDDPNMPNFEVYIINTGATNCERWYVADPETSITNHDGWIGNSGLGDAEQAFKIDWLGVNTPLVFESMAWDNCLEPGETWYFVIQDYVNTLGIPEDHFNSIGIASLSPGWPSSASIITPEPAALSMLLLGSLLIVGRRR